MVGKVPNRCNGGVYVKWLSPEISQADRVTLGAIANFNAGKTHATSFMDWISSISAIVQCMLAQDPKTPINNDSVSKRLCVPKGSFQKYFTPWTHLKEEIRDLIARWDDTDWQAVVKDMGLPPLSPQALSALDEKEIVTKSAFYPKVLSPNDTLEQQRDLCTRVLQHFATTSPIAYVFFLMWCDNRV